jgi:hypothetical protein
MSKIHEKSKLLQVLSETPLVSLACKKTGISRATFYRWYKDDKPFRDGVLQILDIGRKNINDMAESMMFKEMQKGNMNAIRFWLQHNDSRYRPVRTSYVEPILHHHELKAGERCYVCGATGGEELREGTVVRKSSAYEDAGEERAKKMSRKQLMRTVMEKQLKDKEEKRMQDSISKFFRENNSDDTPPKSAYE